MYTGGNTHYKDQKLKLIDFQCLKNIKIYIFHVSKNNFSWKKMLEEFYENVLFSAEVLCLYNEKNMK